MHRRQTLRQRYIDYPRGDDTAIAYLAVPDDDPIGASTIVLSELYRGLMLTQEPTQPEALSKYEWVESASFTNERAAAAADIYAEIRANGDLINKIDIYTAGTACSLGVPLVVGETHFEVVNELEVEIY